MNQRILYAGDDSLATAAGYLAGVLTHFNLPFDYVASDQPINAVLAGAEHALYIISDFPVNRWRDVDERLVLDRVRDGAGLLMIGGWESFHGLGGNYDRSPLAEALPVLIQDRDDRVNCPQPCVIEKRLDHPIVAPLPLDQPPCVGGYNLTTVREGAVEVLSVRHFGVSRLGAGEFTFTAGQTHPLLVVGTFGKGRTAACTSDVAPHWVGGLVDWGPKRVTAQADGASRIEVGNLYAEFFGRLVRWTMGAL